MRDIFPLVAARRRGTLAHGRAPPASVGGGHVVANSMKREHVDEDLAAVLHRDDDDDDESPLPTMSRMTSSLADIRRFFAYHKLDTSGIRLVQQQLLMHETSATV